MRVLALKIDVDTYRGTREGVPPLATALKDAGADATFLFSLGRDHTGRAIKRVFRPGFLQKVSRTSVVEYYGILTLLYGTLLPGPHIGKRCGDIMRAVRDQGFEVGVHTWDHVRWQDNVAHKGLAWTRRELQAAVDQFTVIFGEPPKTHGAAGWQMNAHAYRLLESMGFTHSSDGRGTTPFLPVIEGVTSSVPQYPSTLPTFDELIGLNGVTADNVDQAILALTATESVLPHVFTLHAELEGMKLLPVFRRLLEGWKDQGYTLVSMKTLHDMTDQSTLPRHHAEMGTIPGRSGTLAIQGSPA